MHYCRPELVFDKGLHSRIAGVVMREVVVSVVGEPLIHVVVQDGEEEENSLAQGFHMLGVAFRGYEVCGKDVGAFMKRWLDVVDTVETFGFEKAEVLFQSSHICKEAPARAYISPFRHRSPTYSYP
jgi:hypothetical protein